MSERESLFQALPAVPKTWNEAAHIARADSQPEDFGHLDCPWCEAARKARAE